MMECAIAINGNRWISLNNEFGGGGNRRVFVSSTAISCGTQFSSSSAASYTVVGCSFSLLKSSSGGGAIYIGNTSSTLCINQTTFYNCSASGCGGAVYSNGANINLYMLTAFGCYATSYGNAYYIYLYSGTLFFNFSSLTSCRNTSSYVGNGQFSFWGSSQLMSTNNITSSTSLNYGAFANYNAYPSRCSYANIISNYASLIAIIFFQTDNQGEMTFSNVINNTVGSSTYGIFSVNIANSNHSASYSNFIGNSGSTLFWCSNYYYLLVSHCCISINGYSTLNGSVLTTKCYNGNTCPSLLYNPTDAYTYGRIHKHSFVAEIVLYAASWSLIQIGTEDNG